MKLLALLLTLGTLLPSLAAQTASFAYYGRGCNLGGPPPLIRTTGAPKLGTSITTTAIALPNGIYPNGAQDLPVLLTGIKSISVLIPRISTSQPTNCYLLVDPLVYVFMPKASSTRYQTSLTIKVPNNRALLGFTYFQQWAALYSRGTGPTSIIRTSNAQRMVVGL